MSLSSRLGLSDLPDTALIGKNVLMRVDFNVPLSKDTYEVTDVARITAAVPSIHYILEKKPKSLILMSHLGRPDGKPVVPSMSLKNIVSVLEKSIGKEVLFIPDCVGELEKIPEEEKSNGRVILLENLRFHVEEEGKGVDGNGNKIKASEIDIAKFRCGLSGYADIYINDAFGTAHRAHSSMVGITTEYRAAGFLMKRELEFFSKALESPQSPFLAIVGGSKVSDKILLIQNLLDRVTHLIIGGGMAHTFKKVLGQMKSIGKSLFDIDAANNGLIEQIMEKAKTKGVQILLPIDHVFAEKISKDSNCKTINDEDDFNTFADVNLEDWMGLDCGPKSRKVFRDVISKSKTILWNGPLGVFEFDQFIKGSEDCLEAIIANDPFNCVSIVGGGDTASLVCKLGKVEKISHVSTGGGASLELLEGKELPGVSALSSKIPN